VIIGLDDFAGRCDPHLSSLQAATRRTSTLQIPNTGKPQIPSLHYSQSGLLIPHLKRSSAFGPRVPLANLGPGFRIEILHTTYCMNSATTSNHVKYKSSNNCRRVEGRNANSLAPPSQAILISGWHWATFALDQPGGATPTFAFVALDSSGEFYFLSRGCPSVRPSSPQQLPPSIGLMSVSPISSRSWRIPVYHLTKYSPMPLLGSDSLHSQKTETYILWHEGLLAILKTKENQ